MWWSRGIQVSNHAQFHTLVQLLTPSTTHNSRPYTIIHTHITENSHPKITQLFTHLTTDNVHPMLYTIFTRIQQFTCIPRNRQYIFFDPAIDNSHPVLYTFDIPYITQFTPTKNTQFTQFLNSCCTQLGMTISSVPSASDPHSERLRDLEIC